MLEEYDDYVEFYTKKGSFRVPIIARLATLSIAVPSSEDFGHCPVNEIVERSFYIDNNGQLDAKFAVESIDPFVMFPKSGVIKQGERLVRIE